MITESQADTIVKVFLCHPTPSLLEEPEIKKAKLAIKKHYQSIRRKMPFTEAEIFCKKFWLMNYLRECMNESDVSAS